MAFQCERGLTDATERILRVSGLDRRGWLTLTVTHSDQKDKTRIEHRQVMLISIQTDQQEKARIEN